MTAIEITGEMLVGARSVRGAQGVVHAINPATGETMAPAFGGGSAKDVDEACTLAMLAFDAYRATGLEQRAGFLEAIAQGILDLGDALVERVMSESGLPRGRVEGERGRTVGQLKLFASLVREGRWLDVTLDSALPERKPAPRPDLRMQKIPLGPVAVFGASNFPLAFSVAGGDTASALAAGCPVVAKSHPSHLGTSELVGRVIQKAVSDCGLPEGVFSLVVGEGNAVGEALVAHPAIQAVGFTGSRRGGRALVAIAAGRDVPIPVFAEMSSINPVFLLPGALSQRAEAIAQGLADSATLGTGQFCTKPGIVIGIEGAEFERFEQAAKTAIEAKTATTMLNSGIHRAYEHGVAQWDGEGKVNKLASGQAAAPLACAGQPTLFATKAQHFLTTPVLMEEVFGPTTLLIACKDVEEMIAVAEHLSGQLTATLHLVDGDVEIARRLLPVLERKAGRILANGFPTGVEVSYAMVHGGPFPATSDSRVTSVGATAIERWLRPVCYQDLPTALLPEPLQNGNPLHLWRLVDGKLQQP
ncbi:aldehyde dehydrogenase (NADP(+)) [Edaphobacter dinghuensis]|uniref:2,5-dioxovalerate dehydrogenase n=1 Tax=Edaphobacter dinghuensis TaxID=1560005 RepID=A0A917M487_9BACT|nr:aldehyde dehydrogenase (NADP(+)) [Edaphobacter dinghuensis]GGG74519.1 fatty aldehyde dehydrogenase [Edaphobacter dinghuensis]